MTETKLVAPLARKPYAKPVLQHYGAIAQITQSFAMTVQSAADGGMGQTDKTS